MAVAANYPFLDLLWTIMLIFLWVAWFFILIRVITDVFRRQDIGGGKKTIWVIFLVAAIFLGVLVYLIVNGQGMGERDMAQAKAQKQDFDEYVQSVSSGGAAAEIEKAKGLLDSGAITQAEFEQMKAKALAS